MLSKGDSEYKRLSKVRRDQDTRENNKTTWLSRITRAGRENAHSDGTLKAVAGIPTALCCSSSSTKKSGKVG
jgi:hypothetical protein